MSSTAPHRPSRPSAHQSLRLHRAQTLHSYESATKIVIIYLCSCVFLGRFGSNLRRQFLCADPGAD